MSFSLSPDSLDWSLQHAEVFGDTDIFPPAFEYRAIRHDWPTLRQSLSSLDLHNRPTRPHRQALSPKGRHGFRIATQLDPLDFIVFAALVYEIGDDLEARRVPVSDGVVLSYRFKPDADGAMFDRNIGYSQFQEKSRVLADEGSCSHVVVTDIADYFHRVYSHDLRTALGAATKRTNHVTAVDKLIRGWNQSVSIGIPVGPAPSRLLAEVLLDDVDRILLSEGVKFIRFVDDYRIFCESERQAHEHLALLANTLFKTHTLTLQQHKTNIGPVDQFAKTYLGTEADNEVAGLSQRFEEILTKLGLDNPYEEIEYEQLDDDVQKEIDGLNLHDILSEQILSAGDLDIPLTRFVLRRLGQLDSPDGATLALDHIDRLYPVFVDVIQYLLRLRGLTSGQKAQIGSRVLDLLSVSFVSHLDFHRSWLLHLFTQNMFWDNEDRFVALMGNLRDPFSERKLMLALGRANKPEWFRVRKQELNNYGTWVRRAFLGAASCLPATERYHWYHSVDPGLDELEKAITKWARDNPFA